MGPAPSLHQTAFSRAAVSIVHALKNRPTSSNSTQQFNDNADTDQQPRCMPSSYHTLRLSHGSGGARDRLRRCTRRAVQTFIGHFHRASLCDSFLPHERQHVLALREPVRRKMTSLERSC
jgi:hypothetical protein